MSKIVHMDWGHGGSDPGALGNGLREKDLTMSIGKKVDKTLKDHGVKVVHSRTNDKYVSLSNRAKMANNNKADTFVSIHINSATNKAANGVETFSYPGSKNGSRLSKAIQDELIKAKIFRSNRGTKTANFAVLRLTNMPSALTELGFIVNSGDAKLLRTKQNEMALAIAKGILKYLGISYKPVSSSTSLRLGDRGTRVKALQQDLIKLGYPVGSYGADGVFGKDTDTAVRNLQKDNKLVVDGIVGKATFAKIEELKKTNTSTNTNNGFYRVVAGSYKEKKNAENMMRELKKKGFDSFLVYYEK